MTNFSVRIRSLCLALAAMALLAACDDPSNVGLGLIGEGDSEPQRVYLSGADLPSEREALITGGIFDGLSFSGANRYLVGVADDPIFGVIEAKGYFDFNAPLAIGNDFRDGTVTAVSLHLQADGYAYGDTVAATKLIISDMAEEWTAFATRSDTTLTPGDTVISVDYSFSREMLIISMPADWVAANGSVLIDLNFRDLFDGFEVRASNPSAAVGFDGSDSFMHIVTTTGTADYPMSKLVTTLSKEAVPVIAGRTQVQDGFGDNAVLDFDFDVDSIAGAAISRTVVGIRVDMTIFDLAPQDFFRPIPSKLQLVGIREDGTRRILHEATILTEGYTTFASSVASSGEFTLVRSVQLAVTGTTQFEKYAITTAQSQAAIGSALIYNASAGEDAPEAIVTLTPTPFSK
jgi:hypothetical protein